MKYEWLAYGGRHLHAPDPMAPALRVTDVSVGYPGVQTPVLCGVNVTLPVGSRLALVGANGSGKSTLLKTIAGLLPIKSGTMVNMTLTFAKAGRVTVPFKVMDKPSGDMGGMPGMDHSQH